MLYMIIRGATLVSPDATHRTPVFVHDGYISSTREADSAWQLELRNHLIFPGLINTHDHLHLNNIPPLPRSGPFANSYEWSAAFQSYLSSPAVTAATVVPKGLRHIHGGLKNLLCGATTVVHHDPWHPALDSPAFPVRVLRDFGWSHSLGLGLPAGPVPYGPPVVDSFRATPAAQPWIIHLAEGTDAVAASELSALSTLRCVADNTILVHGVGLTDADIDLVIERSAAVIWCPSSNLAILKRTLNPRRLFTAGRLALGSDSRLSGARDLLDELRVAAANSDLTPRELLQTVTINASRILRAPLIGDLRAGQHADMLVLRDVGGDPYRQLLAAERRDLRAVIRNGVPAIADPDFAEWFAACGVQTARVRLDGYDKLLAVAHLEAIALEPGLERMG